MYKFNYKNLIITGLIAVIIMLLIKGCDNKNAYDQLKIDLDNTTRIKDSLGNVITVKDAQIVENQQSIKDLRQSFFQTSENYNKQIKEVKALIATKTFVHIDTVEVPIIDTGRMKEWEDSVYKQCGDIIEFYENNSIFTGTKAKDSTQHYTVDMTINKKSVIINNLSFIDSQYVALTKMKGGFFRKDTKGKLKFYLSPKTRVEIKHTNPYFKNTGADAFIFDKRIKPNYTNGLVQGVLGGSILTMLLLLSL